MARKRQKIEIDAKVEEAGSAKIEHAKKLAQKVVKKSELVETSYALNGAKILKFTTVKDEDGNKKKYSEYIGNTKKNPETFADLKEKGLLK